ncbi:hypothetical protein D8S78_04275 [Natrialba swarupiae]|nr:hypothetical protein [Natrialba swarupiae]
MHINSLVSTKLIHEFYHFSFEEPSELKPLFRYDATREYIVGLILSTLSPSSSRSDESHRRGLRGAEYDSRATDRRLTVLERPNGH